jgi:hypothetical protein
VYFKNKWKYDLKHRNEPVELVEGLRLGVEGSEGAKEFECQADEKGRLVRSWEYQQNWQHSLKVWQFKMHVKQET